MRYQDAHKGETRTRILEAAAERVREKGPAGVSVAQIMADAGLTHGGFYVHFTSKDDLLAATMDQMFADVVERFWGPLESAKHDRALIRYVEAYLSSEHRDEPGRGCPIAALTSQLPHLHPAARARFDAGVKGLLATLARRLEHLGLEAPEAFAQGMLVEMAGALGIARAVSDPDLSDRLLAGARARITERLSGARRSTASN